MKITESDILKCAERDKSECLLLKPHLSDTPVCSSKSKMGGIPNLSGFTDWPVCECCDEPVMFILQFYRRDFPQFPFPEKSNLFQLFRCTNEECSDFDDFAYDRKMQHYFFSVSEEADSTHLKNISLAGKTFRTVPDCIFQPVKGIDYPSPPDASDNLFSRIIQQGNEALLSVCFDQFTPLKGTKLFGYPSWQQSSSGFPDCVCGRKKRFFFQLSSQDEDSNSYRQRFYDSGQSLNALEWIPHETKIGDSGQLSYGEPDLNAPHGIDITGSGNIFYFVCENCGSDTIESYWDCT